MLGELPQTRRLLAKDIERVHRFVRQPMRFIARGLQA
jgi:hypothetical protein